ncbi:MAG: alpha/beta hydrolase, partial [Planctomycetia bacterium]|nr:alpha/beta hydrolase [Planctomycetia bacterium]
MSTVTAETTFLEVAGRKIQLTHGGNGPPLLYLHSAGGETEWMPFFEKLAENWHVYIPAAPGFCLSEGLDTIDDMQDLVWHTVDLLDVLNLGRVPVVGFSLGAWLGVELAIMRPDRVERLSMIAAAGLRIEGAPMGEIFIDDLDELRELLFFDPNGPAVEQGMLTSLEDSRILLWIRAREATARIGWNPYLHNPKLAGHLHRVQCPTQLIWGRHDRVIPLAHGERYAAQIAGSRLDVIERCG